MADNTRIFYQIRVTPNYSYKPSYRIKITPNSSIITDTTIRLIRLAPLTTARALVEGCQRHTLAGSSAAPAHGRCTDSLVMQMGFMALLPCICVLYPSAGIDAIIDFAASRVEFRVYCCAIVMNFNFVATSQECKYFLPPNH